LKPQSEPHLTSWDDFCRSVLKIIAELSPCSESKLLIVAANRGLERFGDGSLAGLSKLLGQCVQELQARGLVEINGEQLVIAPAGSAEDTLDLMAEPELRPSKLDEASTNQKQANRDYAWEEPRTGTLQTQAQVTGSTERAPEPTTEEIIAAPAGSAEDGDILDLTAELELRPSKLDEASTHQEIIASPAGAAEDDDILDLTAELELPPSKLDEASTHQEIIAAPAGSAEDEDILDLTAELELRPSKLDEASTNQEQTNGTLQTQAQHGQH
jgi:hypothetical protein